MLFTHWSELDDPHRRMAVESIRAHWQQTGQTGVTVRTPYFAREAGFLDEVEWLLTALVGYPDGPLDPNAPPPGFGMPARTKMAAALESGVAKARAADPGDWNTVVIDGLRTCHGGRPFPKMLETSLLLQLPGRKQLSKAPKGCGGYVPWLVLLHRPGIYGLRGTLGPPRRAGIGPGDPGESVAAESPP